MGETSDFYRRFLAAKPFPHLVIDDFLEPDFALALAAEFPAYDDVRFRDPFGLPLKASYLDLPVLGPAFRRLGARASSRSFRRRLEALTGIRGLLYGRDRYPGGAHEYLRGMGLPTHLDFNVLPRTGWYRRLNVLIFLTPGWRPGWGGEVVLGDRASGRAHRTIAPIFNRCLLFSVDECSWYGVRPVAGVSRATRKSASLYYYAAEPPPRTGAPRLTLWRFAAFPRGAKAGAHLDEGLWKSLETPLLQRDRELLLGSPPRRAPLRSPLRARLQPGSTLKRRDVDWLRGELAWRDRALRRQWHYSESLLDEAIARLNSSCYRGRSLLS